MHLFNFNLPTILQIFENPTNTIIVIASVVAKVLFTNVSDLVEYLVTIFGRFAPNLALFVTTMTAGFTLALLQVREDDGIRIHLMSSLYRDGGKDATDGEWQEQLHAKNDDCRIVTKDVKIGNLCLFAYLRAFCEIVAN